MSRIDDSLDLTLVALADPTRRTILRRLAQGDCRVTELAQPFAISLAAVSKHIRILERAGLVRRTVSGREHVISFVAGPLVSAGEWIAAQRSFWEQRLDALETVLEQRVTRKRRSQQ